MTRSKQRAARQSGLFSSFPALIHYDFPGLIRFFGSTQQADWHTRLLAFVSAHCTLFFPPLLCLFSIPHRFPNGVGKAGDSLDMCA